MTSGWNGGLIAPRAIQEGALAAETSALEPRGSCYKGSCAEMLSAGMYSTAGIPPSPATLSQDLNDEWIERGFNGSKGDARGSSDCGDLGIGPLRLFV